MDAELGLYRKYDVRRLGGTPGKHEDCEFFVLDLMHDEFAEGALRVYAEACRSAYPELAADLDRTVFGSPDLWGATPEADHG